MTRAARWLPGLVACGCAGGPPVALRILPDTPIAELAPGPPRYHVLLSASAFSPLEGLAVDGTALGTGEILLPRTVTDPRHGLAVVVTMAARQWRVVLPVHPGAETVGASAPDLDLPFAGPCRVTGSFHGPTHAFPGRRHGVDLVPEAGGDTVLAPCAGEVVARTADRPEGTAEGNELHLRRADGLVVVLSHLAPGSVRAATRARVRAGEPVARMGATGHATGPHLHLEVRGHNGDTVPFRILGELPVAGTRLRGASPPAGSGH